MDDALIDALENRIKKMSDLRRIMNDMTNVLSEVKINVEDLKNFEQDLNDVLKYTIHIRELDEWTLNTLKSFKKISESGGFRVISKKKAGKVKKAPLIDIKSAKQSLLERGIEILPEYEPNLQAILNSSIEMAIDFLASKEKSIENAQKLIGPYRKPEK